jgi:hypothetical protein
MVNAIAALVAYSYQPKAFVESAAAGFVAFAFMKLRSN